MEQSRRPEILMERHSASLGFAVLAALIFATASPPAAAQRVTWKVTVDGIERRALVEPGKDATTTACPLVLVFHGLGGGASEGLSYGLAKAWPEATFVYLQGRSRHFAFLKPPQ